MIHFIPHLAPDGHFICCLVGVIIVPTPPYPNAVSILFYRRIREPDQIFVQVSAFRLPETHTISTYLGAFAQRLDKEDVILSKATDLWLKAPIETIQNILTQHYRHTRWGKPL